MRRSSRASEIGRIEHLENRRLLAVNGLSGPYLSFDWRAGSPAVAVAGETFNLPSAGERPVTRATATVPAAPTGLRVVEVGSRFVRLAWNDVAGEAGYKVERRLDGTTIWNQIGTTGENVTTFLDDKELIAGKTYLYRVRAYNIAGNSPYSSTVVATIPGTPPPPPPPQEMRLNFATYLGGSTEDSARDITTDAQGNIYVTGGTTSADFPTTPGAFDRTYNGVHDIYVAKFSPAGQLIWSTFLGGPKYDRAYAIEVSPADGSVIVAGRGGPGAPTTVGAFQPDYNGLTQPNFYGEQNAFIAKLKPDGTSIIWASYFGPYELIRDIAVDSSGDIYTASPSRSNEVGTAPSAWFTNSFQKTRKGVGDLLVGKIKGDGTQVLWASYLGGSGDDGAPPSIRVGADKQPVVLSWTTSSDLPVTPNAHDSTLGGTADLMLAKFNATGSGLVFCTYLGGSAGEGPETHNLALDSAGYIYTGTGTKSADFPTSVGAYDRTFNGAGGSGTGAGTNYPGDCAITKFSPTGAFLAGTFVGGSVGEAAEGIAVDAVGNVYFTGASYSANFPNTTRIPHRGNADVIACKLSANFSTLRFSSLGGGSGVDLGRAAHVDSAGNFYIAGMTNSADLPDLNAFQERNAGGYDALLAKLSPFA